MKLTNRKVIYIYAVSKANCKLCSKGKCWSKGIILIPY